MACWHCFHHRKNLDNDSAWRRQNLEIDENPVYKLVNIKQTGDLLKLYEDDGEEAVKRKCQSLTKYLYNNSKDSDIIRHEDYRKWRARLADNATTAPGSATEVNNPTSAQASLQAVDYTKDETIMFQDHEAAWDLECRGEMGETALHLCYLNNTPIHLEIAKILLDLYPKLALDIYEAEEYYGESAIHFAVIHGNLESLKLLVEKGAEVNQRATGRFFLPEDQKATPRAKTTNYIGDAYYGEYPLAFAACLGYEAIYEYLLSKGADPNLPDSFGNTVLHMTVIKNKPAMYSYVARHPLKKGDHWKKNYQSSKHGWKSGEAGLTPLALANKLGRHDVFNEILELHKVELWRFSNVNCSIYPIDEVDTIGPGGEMNWSSSLMITLNENTDGHVDMLQSGVLRQLLDEKWKTFVKKRFFLRLAIVLFHLLVLTISASLRPKQNAHFLNTTNDYVRLVTEILTMITCFVAILSQVQEMVFLGIYFFFANLKNAPFKAIYLLGCLLQLMLIPVRAASASHSTDPINVERLQLTEETLLIITLPMTWMMILYFAEVTILCGPLINIVFIYIRRDLLPFLLIVIVVFVAFAASFHQMYKTIDDQDITTFATIYGSFMALFQFTLGEFEYDEFKQTDSPFLTMLVFIIFMIMMPILLLNMLIAMMASTFEKVIKKSEKDWIHQWAKIVIGLEITFTKKQLLKYQQQYSIKIDNPLKVLEGSSKQVDEMREQRGVMVIKTATKTKAKQRKDALRNWKRTAKDVLNKIKEIKKTLPASEEIHFNVVFPYADDSLQESGELFYKRHPRGSRSSVDMAAAVEQLADTMVVKATGHA